ncbi:glucosyl transferase, partial [bacterium]|nr:glucosyl transferase [bacterium]
GGSSSFYDVAIIDENDIWAVGEIYTADDKYNAAHWDGEKWELIKIANDSYPRRVVYAFGKNDVWFDGTIKWDGTRYTVHMKNFPLMPNGDGWYKNAMWGTSSKDFYLVGDHGMIAHYDGQQWQRIESGTDENINDIHGIVNNNKKIIYCVFGKTLTQTIPGVIKIENKNVIEVQWPYNDRIPHSIWFDKPGLIYVAGGEVVLKDYTGEWRIISNLPRYYIKRIRGNADNDIFIAGAYSILAHFNGLGWYLYEYGNSNKHYESLDFKNNLLVVVGHIGGRVAFIKMGKK